MKYSIQSEELGQWIKMLMLCLSRLQYQTIYLVLFTDNVVYFTFQFIIRYQQHI